MLRTSDIVLRFEMGMSCGVRPLIKRAHLKATWVWVSRLSCSPDRFLESRIRLSTHQWRLSPASILLRENFSETKFINSWVMGPCPLRRQSFEVRAETKMEAS